MTKIFRLASPDDYTFNHKIGLYELSFDKRPIQGVRCENPALGAEQYNTQRLKIIRAQAKKWQPDSLDFSEIIKWAVEHGTPIDCQAVWELYHCKDEEQYNLLAIHLSRRIKSANLSMILFFTGKRQRILKDISLLQKLDQKREIEQ
ncbi:hypothetical protein NOM68_06585 [Proteus mirabilis]|uniref:hypothetical protein n=1 Tax=Proteus mirabilis TaxID=584 RepID=UPI001BAF91B4|nr:hypothetical protein [Proteus mirabilis]MBS3881201.1 hypothetical protein [Proteus mirabilis]MCS6721228.1 hypothetical protein [Proteus mirabilis]MCS6727923.1 hypothetical protein [Proteus mirabilis]MCS6736779.1 hypothetical protein [Proteus mirabilis]MCT0093865.1 hypothetical protein [Proteus mirabilis]